jgi:hypothetical protein
MPFFASAEQLYACANTLFSRIQEQDPAAANALLGARLLITIRCHNPTAEISLNGRQRPLVTSFGPSSLRPDLEVQMATDTLHQILLGELTIKRALASGQLKVKGPVWKTTALAELFERGQALWPAALREHGYGA